MLPFRQFRDLYIAALEDSSSGDLNLPEATGTLWNRLLSRPIEPGYEAAPEVSYLGEGMGLTALVDHAKGRSLLDLQDVRFEVPLRIWMSRLCL